MRKLLCLFAAMAPFVLSYAQESEGGQDNESEDLIIYNPPDYEIVVTAQRINQLKSDVPASVEVFGSFELDRTALVHPAEILNTAPGVHIHRGSGL